MYINNLKRNISSILLNINYQRWAEKITGAAQPLENLPATDMPAKSLVVAMTTDKGLCGGVNTILGRMTKQLLTRMDAEGKSYQLLVLGEKGKGQLRRIYGDKIVASLSDRAVPYNFELASAISQEIVAQDFDSVHILYNAFKSAIVYIPSIKSIQPKRDPTDPIFSSFEVEPDNDAETLENFFEYTLATQVLHSLLENATSEQSSRMNAMENASKNASEMIGKLTLQYNRARQARITTELIEIISGASALKAN